MSVHIGIVTISGHGHYAVSASLGGVEVERTVEAHKTTLPPAEALNLAMLLTRAVSECRHMREAEGEIDKLVEALCFAHDGFEKHVRPLIDAYRRRHGGAK